MSLLPAAAQTIREAARERTSSFIMHLLLWPFLPYSPHTPLLILFSSHPSLSFQHAPSVLETPAAVSSHWPPSPIPTFSLSLPLSVSLCLSLSLSLHASFSSCVLQPNSCFFQDIAFQADGHGLSGTQTHPYKRQGGLDRPQFMIINSSYKLLIYPSVS